MQNQFLASETSEELIPYVAPIMATTPEELEKGVLQTEVTQASTSTQAVTDLLTRAQGKIRLRRKKFWAGMAVSGGMYLLVNILIGIVWQINAGHGDNSRSYLYPLTLLPLLLAAIPMAWMALVPIDVDLEELGRLGDVNAVPMLIDSINLNVTTKYRKRVSRALTILLPLLKASDANLLTPLRRYTLNIMLGSCFQPHLRGVDEDFTLAILKAYEQVGDAKAVSVVKRIANHRPRNAGQRRIQEAAAECLPLLRANLGEVASTQTLLRASTIQASTPDMLLRPASAASSTPSAELLRSAPNEPTPHL